MRPFAFLFWTVSAMCVIVVLGTSAGNADSRPQWLPNPYRAYSGSWFRPYSDETQQQKASQWWMVHFGREYLSELEVGRNRIWRSFEVAMRSCSSAACITKEWENYTFETDRFIDELYEKYIEKGPWKPRKKKIYMSIQKVSSTFPCGWYVAARLLRRHFDEPELIPDFGGARCREVSIKVVQEGELETKHPNGEGSQYAWNAVNESEGEFVYARDFQDFYIRNNSTLISKYNDRSELLDATGAITECDWTFVFKKCETQNLSKDDFDIENIFGVRIEFPPKALIPHTEISGGLIYEKTYGGPMVGHTLNGSLDNGFSVSPDDARKLLREGKLAIKGSYSQDFDSSRSDTWQTRGKVTITLEIEIVPRGGGLARVGDRVAGGGAILEGSSTVFINGKPAARVGDKVGGPEGGGKIASGMETVFIEGRPAAQLFDLTDAGDYIGEGSPDTVAGSVIETVEAK
jgi:uncharacterized Zn-binding protein involved in type VI secretion